MMRIEVRTFHDQPPLQPLAAEFDEMGGTIGRSEGNTLVLPDEKRYISRTQVSIKFRAGSYVLCDHGSATPTLVNGSAVGNGREVVLRGDEEVRIGDYVLGLTLQADPLSAGAPADPFADLLPASPGAPQSAGQRPPAPPTPQFDPFNDPFNDPFAPAAPRRNVAPPGQPGVIPQDFDPFADLVPQSPAAPSSGQLPDLDLSGASNENVDDLFGLKGGAGNWDPLAPADPFAAVHENVPGALSNDPLAAFSAPSARPQERVPVQRDDAPMLSGAFRPPQPRNERPKRTSDVAPPPEEPRAPPPNDMVVSWDEALSAGAGGEIKSVVLASPKRSNGVSPVDEPRVQARAAFSPEAVPAQAPAGPAASAGAARALARPSSTEAEREALLRAFLSGAGMADLKIPGGLTPELMDLLGQLIRESIRGTLDLLLARALTKREVRAQATVIVARGNNPLKFSPTVEAALTHLFAPQGQGFMPPAQAVRDAHNDLRSHQFGFMAGMRAALEGVLARFDPAQIEQRLAQKGLLGALVPSSRRARLWELYERLYRDISTEAEDDFHTLFGKEFLRAYEAQIEKLEQEDAAGKR